MGLAKVGDELSKDHYIKLSKNAKACIECGVCEKNCPFHVEIRGRMREAINYFDKL
jgi:predicted aldo/keto reductase-like oxidoreductase